MPCSLHILKCSVNTETSPNIELLSGGSYTSGHGGCLGEIMIGTNSSYNCNIYTTSPNVWCRSDKM